jgi:glycosyltransferase involved in cell wall biosynthesis
MTYEFPIVSTIIPTYRRPELLHRAIRSVLGQTYPAVRVCVFDNASGDETSRVVAEIAKSDPRVRYFAHPRNIGLIPNFAFGISRVQTPFFSLLSDDDLLLPDFYRTAIAALRAVPSAMLFAGNALIRDEINRRTFSTSRRMAAPGVYEAPAGLFSLLREDTPRMWTGMVFRSTAMREVNNLDENLLTQHDHDFVVRMAVRYPAIISNHPCAIYVKHSAAAHIVDDGGGNFWAGWFAIIDKLANDVTLPPATRKAAAATLARKVNADIWRETVNAIAAGRLNDARHFNSLVDGNLAPLAGRLLHAAARQNSLGGAVQRTVALALGLKRSVRAVGRRIVGPRPSDQLAKFSLDAFPAD